MKAPIYIINRNRLQAPQSMVRWLSRFDNEIIIIDNASTYEPLLAWYPRCGVEVIRLASNFGHLAGWHTGIFSRRVTGDFIVSDADLDLRSIPDDWEQVLERGLYNSPYIKCGFSLEINDIPDHFPFKQQVQQWESQFWLRRAALEQYWDAPIDTTFALYRREAKLLSSGELAAWRTDRPYTARHLPWYVDPLKLDEEEAYFIENASDSSTYAVHMRAHGIVLAKDKEIPESVPLRDARRDDPSAVKAPGDPDGRMAIVFDDTVRSDTTGIYCWRALQALYPSVTHLRPQELHSTHSGEFGLFIYIDDGLEYDCAPHLHPAVFWAIDTHCSLRRATGRARGADFVFAAQKGGVDLLRRSGANCLGWLPLACDPASHRKTSAAKELDVCFVAHFNTAQRCELAQTLRATFPSSFVGQCYFDEMANIYSRSKVIINLSQGGDLNMRVFEALSCGSLLLTDSIPRSGLDELFQEGVHLETYRDTRELIEKAKYYIAHNERCEHLAMAGRELVAERHTYRHRMAELVRIVKSELWPSRALAPTGTAAERKVWHIGGGLSAAESVAHDLLKGFGCVMAARNRPAEYLERTFQSFALQKCLPADRVFVDYGSDDAIGKAYQAHCVNFGWRYIRIQPAHPVWSSADAYNIAISALDSSIDVVFKCDIDLCLGEGVLHTAHLRGRTRVCCFANVFAAAAATSWPQRLTSESLRDLLNSKNLRQMDAAGVVSFPRRWFEDVGGYDLSYKEWGYEDSDLLDRAERSVGVVRERWNYLIHQWHPRSINRYQAHQNHEYFLRSREFGNLVRNISVETSFAKTRSLRSPANERAGLTSIVILTHNEIEITQQCLDSIREYTPEPYEIIVVDNASSDRTPELLAGQVTHLIRNKENLGFPKAANQGIRASKGEFILLLNNDVIVTDGWLGRLQRPLLDDFGIGLVGPVSNCVGSAQQVSVTYSSLTELQPFAREWALRHYRQTENTDRLTGFCLLFRRQLIDAIGLLDERFGMGNFEDDDFCLRTRLKGYSLVTARDCFVHHFGSHTFRKKDVDLSGLLQENFELFLNKWKELGFNVTDRFSPETQVDFDQPETFMQRDSRTHVRISLCMIVRNSSRTLRACLDSVSPYVDEMIVVDTGSTDDTRKIAAACGARVLEFPWCDSFSAARNESVRHASGDWVFWMDSDDTIDPANGRKLRELLEQDHGESILGFVMQVHCPGAESESSVTRVDHVKMFRNDRRLQFEGRIHEQILPSIRRCGGEVKWTDIFVVHSGSDQSLAGRAAKQERDLRLLDLELAEKPGHSFTLFNLGMTLADAGRHAEAVASLTQALGSAEAGESHLRKLYALLIGSLVANGRDDQAASVCSKAISEFPDDPELLFRSGVLRHATGDHAGARDCFETILRGVAHNHFGSIDYGILGFKTRHNLALLKQDVGDPAAAEQLWRDALREAPDFLPAWNGLIDLLCTSQRFAEAHAECIKMGQVQALACESWVQRSRIHEWQGETAEAEMCLATARRIAPEDPGVLRALAHSCFHKGDLLQAESYLKSVLERSNDDAAAHHNLACVLARLGRREDAVGACKQSLQLRPDSRITQELLSQLVSTERA